MWYSMRVDHDRAALHRAWKGVRAFMVLLLLWFGAGGVAAACTSPQSATIPAGGSIEFDCFGGAYQDTVIAPLFGTISPVGSGLYSLTYKNTVLGHLSDTFTVIDENGNDVQFNITILPSAPSLTVTPTTLPSMVYGQVYSPVTLSTTGGTAPYTYSFTGTPPDGIAISGSGVISGTPSKAGSFSFSVHVADSSGTPKTTDQSYTVSVALPTLSLTPVSIPSGTQGSAYSTSLMTTGGTAPYTYALSSGTLPSGITLNATGTISGTPTQAGNFPITVRVTDSTPSVDGITHATTTRTYTLQVALPPPITLRPSLPDGSFGTAYSQAITASGGTAPYQFTATGSVPTGLTLNANGSLSGTPTGTGTFNFTVTATDANSFTGTQAYTVNIAAVAPGAPSVSSVSVAAGGLGTPASAVVAFAPPGSNGGSAITGYAVTSSPGGIVASGSASPITVPGLTRGTAYTFTVTASNTVGTGPASGPSGPVTPQITQNISFTNPGPQNFGTSPTLTASVDTGQPLTFSSTTTPVCTIVPATGQLTFLTAGNCSITVSQPGNGTYVAASQSQSFAVNAVVPGAPTIGTATAVDGTPGQSTGGASVAFTPPAFNGGGAITGYTVTSSPGNITATGSTSPLAVAGLTFGTAYTFTVTASSTAGTGAPSAASNAATPMGSQTITFANPGQVNFGTTTPLVATTSSGLPVQFTSQTANVCEIVSLNQLHAKAPGMCTVQASQPGGGGYRAAPDVTQGFSVVVAGGPVSITTTTLPAPTRGVPYSATITSQGGAEPYSYVISAGALPNGLTLTPASPTSALISGTVTSTGPYSFTVQVTDLAGQTSTKNYSGSIISPVFTFTPANLPAGTWGGIYPSTTIAASGGIAPYTYAVTSGSLPTGLVLAPNGTLSGTPTAAGTFNITVTATDSFTVTGSQAYTITVGALRPSAPVIGTVSAPAAPAGQTTGSAVVAFTPPSSDGGAAITGYTVTSSPGGITATGSAPSITVPGLTLGTAYTFTVTATNPVGTSDASAASASVTPQGQQQITFNNPGPKDFGTTTPLVATTTSGLPVQFTSQTVNVCAIVSGSQLQAKAPGTCTVVAAQGGDQAYLPAAPVSQGFSVVVPGGAVTIATTTLPNPVRGATYSQGIVAQNGAPPYSFTLSAGALPNGLVLNPSGQISGSATVSGTFPFTVQVTDLAGQTATQNYNVTIAVPTFTFTPATLPGGKVAVAYPATTLATSGGIAPYAYAITSGALPAGLTLSSAGAIVGTPTAAGSASVTITATDAFGATGSQGYTIVVAEATPVAVDDKATVGANASVTIPVTANDSGPITSIAITQAAGHGTATIDGLNVVYTPAHDYFGNDTLKYTATGPGGTSNVATVSITVAAGPVPVPVPSTKVTVLSGQSVTIHAAAGATNGPFTSVAVVAPPSSGSVQVQGTDLVYTAAADASGEIGFDFTLSNAFGASQPAHVNVTVNPAPIAPPVTAATIAGRFVQVDITSKAQGGPFTGANVVSVSPANAGSASIQASATGYMLLFTASPTFGGTAQIGYTLTNAYATSAPGYVTVTVTPRSDPSKDPEVLGVLSAQADETRRMATGQISNFQRRLEMLHSGGTTGFTNGITMASASSSRSRDAYADLRRAQDDNNRRYLVQPDAGSPESQTAASSQHGTLPGDVSVWTGGAINFGKSQAGTSDNGIDFTTSGLSVGVDKQFSDKLAVGAGMGYGHDHSDVGNNGSRSTVDSYNVAVYGSYRPTESFYTDALIGYQWLSFDSRRFVTDNGNHVEGSRDGKQWFASLSAGYQMVGDNSQFTPYGRFDVARARLDAFTEHGDDVYSLRYQSQTVKTTTATLGVLAQWSVKRDYGVWAPQLRAEFGHDLQGSSQAVMRYADLIDGPLYRATLYRQSRNHTLLGAGIVLQTNGGWMIRAEYQNQLDNTTRDNQSILLGIEKKFGP